MPQGFSLPHVDCVQQSRYGVICQFSPSGGKPTLKDFINLPDVYPAGRLDTDSEGLLLLTDDGVLQARIADPAHKLPKTLLGASGGRTFRSRSEPSRRPGSGEILSPSPPAQVTASRTGHALAAQSADPAPRKYPTS